MSDIRYINIEHDGVTTTLAVGSGMSVIELESVIRSIFRVKGNVVGFQAQNTGLVVPLSLACKNANSLPGTGFTLLTTGAGRSQSPSLPRPPSASASKPIAPTNRAPPVNPPAPPTREEAPSTLSSTSNERMESQDADDAMDELLRFIAALRIKQMLTKSEADALEELLFENSTLIYAAYSVAKSAGDPKYLATVCRDIAQSLMTDMGRAGCAAQDEVLQYCDRLFVMGKITENQLLYMRHMVLIRDDVVATLYDDFQHHRNPDRFAAELFRLANTHPRWIDGEEAEGGEDDDDESEKVLTSAVYPDTGDYRIDENKSAVLTGIVNLMSRAGSLTPNEANILRRLVDGDNDYVTAAYELFQQDGDVEELEDTLSRISRLEIARSEAAESSMRSAARQEAETAATRVENRKAVNPFSREAQARLAANRGYYQDEQVDDYEDEDEDEEASADESSDEDEAERDDVEIKGAQKYVENFLSGLGVRNTWDQSVPERFIVAVFATAQKGLLTIGQARALCDLYQARYDLVLAAWEVFTVQGDVPDLMDTLLRIVRGLNFNSNGELVENRYVEGVEASESESSEDSESSDEERSTDKRTSEPEDVASDTARREVAIRAVAQAKQDLLRHSLEMMVKQGIAPADKAAALFKRALEGDLLVDAAIEAYANDRNVADFLDTLNILLTHSPAELQSIMDSAMARQAGGSGAIPATRIDNTGRMPVGSAPAQNSSSSGQMAPRFPAPPTAPSSAAEAEAEGADLDAAQMQLRDIVSELADRDILSPVGMSILIKLIITRDDRVLGAHDVYRDSGDLGDLVDSLIRIARLEQANPMSSTTDNPPDQRSDDSGIEMASFKKLERMRQESERGFEMTDLNHGDAMNNQPSEADLKHHRGQASGIHPLSRAGSMDSLPSSPATASVTKSPASAGKVTSAPSSDSKTQAPGIHPLSRAGSMDALPRSPATESVTKSPVIVSKNKSDDEDDEDDDEDSDDNAVRAPLLTLDDQQSILDILNNAGAISNVQYAALLRLLKVRDRRLGTVFQQYEQDKDVHGLIGRLGDVSKMLVDMINEEAEEDAQRESDDSQSEDDDNDSEEDDDNEAWDEEDDELDEVILHHLNNVTYVTTFFISCSGGQR